MNIRSSRIDEVKSCIYRRIPLVYHKVACQARSLNRQKHTSALVAASSLSGGFSDGGGGQDLGRSQGSGNEPDNNTNPQYPIWLKAWLLATAVFYLYARTKWRADLHEKVKEREREERVQQREDEEWDRFKELFRGRGSDTN